MSGVGIMQGRLSRPVGGRIQCFPRETWADELPLAARAGLDAIEWIYDVDGLEANPFGSDEGPSRVAALALEHGVAVRSLCADYFMARRLVRDGGPDRSGSVEELRRLRARAAAFGVERIVLPFVDASSLGDPGDRDALVELLGEVLADEDGRAVELHLETDLAPEEFARLLERLPDPRVRVNYDSGNSAALGYAPRVEFEAYGRRVGSVHVKDRVLRGGSVPLGTGDADFDALARALSGVAYDGDFVLQAARGEPGDELAWAIRNRRFVRERLLGSAAT